MGSEATCSSYQTTSVSQQSLTTDHHPVLLLHAITIALIIQCLSAINGGDRMSIRRSHQGTDDVPMFASPDGWRTDPLKAFDEWAVNARKAATQACDGNSPLSPLLRPSSIKVYAAMWSSFVRSAKDQKTDLFEMGDDEIAKFLTEQKAHIGHQHRRRYARVIARALAQAREAPDAPGHPRLRRPEVKADDEPTPFLNQEERDRVFRLLSECAPAFDTPASIARARSMALCALLLGGGLKPGETLLCSSVNCALLRGENYISLEVTGLAKTRVAFFEPRARSALQHWIDWRASQAGTLLFPAKPGARKPTLDYARAFVGVKKLLLEAGVVAGGERASPQTLRNAYGAALIESGQTDEAIRHNMGFSRMEFARRFIAAHQEWTKRHG
jgi:integrase